MRYVVLSLLPLALAVPPASAQLQVSTSPRGHAASDASLSPAASLPPAPTVGSDACATAEALGNATGSFGFDLTSATTGTEGQITFTGGDCNYGCAEYGTSNVQVPGDVWFSWTAPATGRVRLSTCPNQTDAKLAVYFGPTCPTGTTCVACSDDYHGSGGAAAYSRDAIVYFDAVVGTSYLIQVGRGFSLFAGAGFLGAFTIEVGPLPRETLLDDGAAEVGFSIGAAGNGNCRLQRFGLAGNNYTVASTDVSWGWAGQTGLVNGTACTVAIWDDPNDDGIPTDCVLLQQVATTMQNVGTDTFVNIPFSPPVTVSGSYFIGVASQTLAVGTGTDFPLTADNTVCTVQPDTAWYGSNTALPYDVTNLAANSLLPTRLQAVNCQAQGTTTYNGLYHVAWTIRSNVLSGPPPVGTPECFGDGTGATACPCANNGGAGRGCANSAVGSQGAVLSATGVASIGADTVTITCTDLTGPGLFFAASGVLGTPVAFGDGILCAAVGIVRMGVVFPTGNAASYPGGLTPNPIHVAGGIGAPGTFHFQCWYRDAIAFCTVATYNMSNGLSMAWAP